MFTAPRTSRRQLRFLILIVMANEIRAHVGSCEDHSPDCAKWESSGHCRTNLRFMAHNCPVSCNICLDPECYNRSPFCDSWEYQGFCSHSEEVKRLCPHSCNLCKIPDNLLPVIKSITQPDFDCGRPKETTPSFERTKRQTNPVAGYLLYDVQGRPKRQTGRSPLRISITDAFCGAAVIHERFLITAAHCVFDPEKSPLMVRVGELDFSRDFEARSRPADYRVKQIFRHPQYKHNSLERYNDIAIIETEEKMQFNEVVYPHCILNQRPAINSSVTGSGFGFVNQTHRSDHAQEANFTILDAGVCEAIYANEGLMNRIRHRYPRLIQGSDIICASFPGADACQGDSGGPLFQTKNGRRSLVGVISQGLPCSGQQYHLPGFYVSVADHINFINNVIYPNQ